MAVRGLRPFDTSVTRENGERHVVKAALKTRFCHGPNAKISWRVGSRLPVTSL
jgi:hypothetical protein